MVEKLQRWIGQEIQAATAYDTVAGTLISVDRSKMTVRTSAEPGYGNGGHAIILLDSICYVRLTLEVSGTRLLNEGGE